METARNPNGTFKKGFTPWSKGRKGITVAWNKGIRKIPFTKKVCTKCSEEYLRRPHEGDTAWLKRQFCSKSCKSKGNTHNIGKKHSDETRAKMREKHPSGEASPYWIKDRTKLRKSEKKHLDGQYQDWMKQVKNRDNWKCRINNSDCQGRLEAHHILPWREYPELRYQINNGIALCHAHHPRKRAEEKRLVPYFQELVSVSKD